MPGILTSVLAAIAVAWAARRLLGARKVSLVRTALAAIGGLLIGWTVGGLIKRGDVPTEDAVIAGVVLAVLATMVLLIALELVARPKPATAFKPRRQRGPVKAVRERWRDGRRLTEVVGIARRNGMGGAIGLARADDTDELAPDELGRRMKATLEEAGGVYVKLGQLFSTRPDIFPAATLDHLARLQADVTPAPRAEIEARLTTELGRPTDDVFEDFDWDPLGAASIGQVYRARLVGGHQVVVKVRRPGIVPLVERDLGIVTQLAASIEKRAAWARQYGMVALAEEFAADLRGELDYNQELVQTRQVAAAFASEPAILVPEVYEDLSTSAVLVMDLVEGPSVGQSGTRTDGEELASKLFRAEVGAMLRGDAFHADPHPGNVLLTPDGRIGLIDLGSTGRLDAFERAAVTDILTALHLRDPTLLRDAVTQVAEVGDDVDLNVLERTLARLLADHLGVGQQPSVELVTDFLSIVRRFGIALPPTILMVFRALGTMAGTVEILDPGFSLIDAAREFAGEQMRDRAKPDSAGEMLRDEAIALAPLLRRAPRHLDRIAAQLERGELTARVRAFSHPDDIAVLTKLVNRFVLAFLGVGLGLVSVLLFRTIGGPAVTDELALYELFGVIGILGGALLVMRVILEVLGDRS